MNPVYDTIGKTYDSTRCADPMIVKTLLTLLDPIYDGSYLDLGCGSGNYTKAIFDGGYRITGVDISEEMLSKARKKHAEIEWVAGDARDLPFDDAQFDGAISTLATHHIKDIKTAFKEMYRVLKGGNFIIFTSFREQMSHYWLNEYFPDMMRLAMDMMHTKQEIFSALQSAGFTDLRAMPFFVTNELKDWFLQSGKYRPHIYLDPIVRAGISTFALKNEHEQIMTGCKRLEEDIASGNIKEVIASYESDLGDYVFISAATAAMGF